MGTIRLLSSATARGPYLAWARRAPPPARAAAAAAPAARAPPPARAAQHLSSASACQGRSSRTLGRRVKRVGAVVACGILSASIPMQVLCMGGAPDNAVPASDFHVVPIAGDGNCLFRAVAQGASLRASGSMLAAPQEGASAAALRAGAMAELVARREDVEWFIEGDFDSYCTEMGRSGSWGGEPEILMLTHHLHLPIAVYMAQGGGLLSPIAEYGQEYGGEGAGECGGAGGGGVRLLFHGLGHYELLVAVQEMPSKL